MYLSLATQLITTETMVKHMLERLRKRIREKKDNANTPPVLIVALGDSVTHGYTQDRIEHDAVYHRRLQLWLESHYPETVFSVINAGVNGDSSAGGLKHLDRDVITHQPDLVLIAFGLNDTSGGLEKLPEFHQNLVNMIGTIRTNTEADIVLLTPNFMATRPNDCVPEKYVESIDDFIQLQKHGIVAAYAQEIRDVSDELTVPLADVYAAWQQLADTGVDTTSMLANGINHPIGDAHQIAADAIIRLINPEITSTEDENLGDAVAPKNTA